MVKKRLSRLQFRGRYFRGSYVYRRHTCLIGSFVREGVLEFALGPIRTSVSVISSELPTENPQPFHISTSATCMPLKDHFLHSSAFLVGSGMHHVNHGCA